MQRIAFSTSRKHAGEGARGEGPGSELCILKIGCVMLNLIQSGVSIVSILGPEELDGEHRKSKPLF